jgi:hypothetical protein
MRTIGPFGRRLAAAAGVMLLLMVPSPALADCMPGSGLEQAIGESDLVFVGTVAAVRDEGRSATVQVTEVWRGAAVPALVEVLGGQDPARPMEDDRSFDAGVTYLFLPALLDGRLVDGACSATQPWSEALAALRPSDAHPPAAAAATGTGLPEALGDLALPVLTAALVGGAVIAIAFAVARRRDA